MFHKGPQLANLTRANADLWDEIWEMVAQRKHPVTVKWVKSHCDDPKIWAKYKPKFIDVHGNYIADKLAGLSARDYEVASATAAQVKFARTKVRDIQKRIIAIIMSIPKDKDRKERVKATPRLSKHGLALTGDHKLELSCQRWRCTEKGL